MKKLYLFFVIAAILSSCASDDDFSTELSGTWKLTETLVDIGDGNMMFEPVTVDRTINFSVTGTTVTSDQSFCATAETFTAIYNSEEGTITVDDCDGFPNYIIYVEFQRNTLILSYPCFEACLYKYVRQ